MGFSFVVNSILLGVGLAMDAFSVSLANGLQNPHMTSREGARIAGTFAFFQFIMPVIGWVCVHTLVSAFRVFERFIPWIALLLLLYIGGKMLMEGIKGEGNESSADTGTLLMQGIATSIDALSVGFTIADYNTGMALTASLIIAAVTFAICSAGLLLGRKFGTRLAGRASILGGVVLILIGVEIFVKGVF